MNEDLPTDRLGAMWLHAVVNKEPDRADLVLELASDRRGVMLAALAVAVKVLRDSPVAYHNVQQLHDLLMMYAHLENAQPLDGRE